MTKRVFLLTVLASGGAAGCGGSSTGGAATGSVPLDQFASAEVDAECALFVRCGIVSDVPLCRLQFAAGGFAFTPGVLSGFNLVDFARPDFDSLAAIVAATTAGKAHYDPVAARACLDAVTAIECGAMREAPGILGDVCQKVFTGTIADGGRCVHDLECLPGRFCAGTGTCDGTCMPAGPLCNADVQCGSGQACQVMSGSSTDPSIGSCVTEVPPGTAGEPCGTNNRCEADLLCGLSGTCVPSAREGEPCNPGFNPYVVCAGGLVCISDDSGNNPTCMKPAARGESCQVKAQCGGMFSSLICDETRHKCVDWATGGPCNPDYSGCPLTAFCDTTASPPTCKPDPPLGSACKEDNSNTLPCGAALHRFCVYAEPTDQMGTCQSLLPPTCTP
jgi:hypothetical protein